MVVWHFWHVGFEKMKPTLDVLSELIHCKVSFIVCHPLLLAGGCADAIALVFSSPISLLRLSNKPDDYNVKSTWTPVWLAKDLTEYHIWSAAMSLQTFSWTSDEELINESSLPYRNGSACQIFPCKDYWCPNERTQAFTELQISAFLFLQRDGYIWSCSKVLAACLVCVLMYRTASASACFTYQVSASSIPLH